MTNELPKEKLLRSVARISKELGRYLESVDEAIAEDSDGGTDITSEERQRIINREEFLKSAVEELLIEVANLK